MKQKAAEPLFIIFSIILFTFVTFPTDAVFAGPETRTHDGFFLRLLPGYGYGKAVEEELLGYDLELNGGTGMFLFQVGYALLDNFILFGEASGFLMTNPDVKWGNQSADTEDTTYQVVSFGAGASFYIMPINIYIAASLNGGRARLQIDNISGESEVGFGINTSIGKEWWIDDNWGLGIAFILHYSSMKLKEPDGDHDLTNLFYGIAFSVTYN